MSLEELEEVGRLAAEHERVMLVILFGEDGAKRYRRLERASESIYDHGRADAAFGELEQMRGALTERESNLLFGIGEELIPDAEEVAGYIRALSGLDYSSPANLGDSLKYAFIKVGYRDDPRGMTEGQRQGLAQIRAAAEYAGAAGWEARAVLEAARAGIRKLYDDPSDGLLMSARVTSMMLRAETAGSWYYAVTEGSKAVSLAP